MRPTNPRNANNNNQMGGLRNNKKTTNKKKVNPLGVDARVVDYLDPKVLGRFTNDQGKILPKRITGVSAYQQRRVAQAIKYARHLALMPFVAQDVA